MESNRRVGWLRDVAALLARQREAMRSLDVDLALAVAGELEQLVQQAPAPPDLPLSPTEVAWSRIIGEAAEHNSRLLLSLTEPLYQLDAAARQANLAVALDYQA